MWLYALSTRITLQVINTILFQSEWIQTRLIEALD